MHYALALLPATHLPTVSLHTHTHPRHTHTHTETGLVPLAMTLGSYFPHCIHNACTCARTHLHCYVNSPYTIFITHTHTDWACTACSDFGFLLLSLSLQSVHVHECTHMCTHTCMRMHTHTHTHTDWAFTTCSDFGFLFLTLSLQSA